jgi:hypothetical protein
VLQCLPLFVDEFFLHHPGEISDFLFSTVLGSFGTLGVLDHTSILITHRKKESIVTEELALSTPYLPWGRRLPPCPSCSSSTWVRCKAGHGPRSGGNVKVICELCKSQGEASRPDDVRFLSSRDHDHLACFKHFMVRSEYRNRAISVTWGAKAVRNDRIP